MEYTDIYLLKVAATFDFTFGSIGFISFSALVTSFGSSTTEDTFIVDISGAVKFVLLILLHYFVLVPLDCLVGEWTKWSERDKDGKITRRRDVLRYNLNGGEKCPTLEQTQLGMHFNSLNTYR